MVPLLSKIGVVTSRIQTFLCVLAITAGRIRIGRRVSLGLEVQTKELLVKSLVTAVAAVLAARLQPTNLTELQKTTMGNSLTRMSSRFCSLEPMHRQMDRRPCPVWGPILGNMNRLDSQDKQLRISNLSR
jgi:hypothetical protein